MPGGLWLPSGGGGGGVPGALVLLRFPWIPWASDAFKSATVALCLMVDSLLFFLTLLAAVVVAVAAVRRGWERFTALEGKGQKSSCGSTISRILHRVLRSRLAGLALPLGRVSSSTLWLSFGEAQKKHRQKRKKRCIRGL